MGIAASTSAAKSNKEVTEMKCSCKPHGSGKNTSCPKCHPKCICPKKSPGSKPKCLKCHPAPKRPNGHDKVDYQQKRADRGKQTRTGAVLAEIEAQALEESTQDPA